MANGLSQLSNSTTGERSNTRWLKQLDKGGQVQRIRAAWNSKTWRKYLSATISTRAAQSALASQNTSIHVNTAPSGSALYVHSGTCIGVKDQPDPKWPQHLRPALWLPAIVGGACRHADGSSAKSWIRYQYNEQQGPHSRCQELIRQSVNQHNQAVQLKADVSRGQPRRGTRPRKPCQAPQHTTQRLQQQANAHAAAQQRQPG